MEKSVCCTTSWVKMAQCEKAVLRSLGNLSLLFEGNCQHCGFRGDDAEARENAHGKTITNRGAWRKTG